eukprot:5465061-Heterocapsa_arctica.AAC.1
MAQSVLLPRQDAQCVPIPLRRRHLPMQGDLRWERKHTPAQLLSEPGSAEQPLVGRVPPPRRVPPPQLMQLRLTQSRHGAPVAEPEHGVWQ